MAKSEKDKTVQAERIVIGNCPECAAVVAILNNHEVWPLVYCKCGWRGGTLDINNHTRFESGGRVSHG